MVLSFGIYYELQEALMYDFILSTESTADLSQDFLKEKQINTINMLYTVDGKEYGEEGEENLLPHEFYKAMAEGKSTHTSMINEKRATVYFTRLLSLGKDVLHISFSSACSGTYECLKAVSEKLNQENNNKIYVVDSKCASGGQGLLVEYVAEYAKTHDAKESYQYALNLRSKVNHVFTVDDLKYLARGGRISKTSSVIGNALRIKPVLYVDDDGRLTPLLKVISRKSALTTIANLVAQNTCNLTDRITVCHADCLEEAKFVCEKLEKLTGITPKIDNIGYVIGCHSGPGTIAVFFLSENRTVKH